jgi:AcrR family transcriptional regulator
MEIVSFHSLRTEANATPMPADAAARRKRSRRTQAERSAETREKIITAATACIAQRGVSNATMYHIAQRSGVTWGAMQHQFGDKDAIIDAVVERSIQEFADCMKGLREAEPDLRARIRAFTDRAWRVFKGPSYRVILNILLQQRERTERIAAAFTALWFDIFGDLHLSRERQLAAQRFTFVMLSGIATESVLVPGVETSKHHFEVIEGTLLSMLGSPASDRRTACGQLGQATRRSR